MELKANSGKDAAYNNARIRDSAHFRRIKGSLYLRGTEIGGYFEALTGGFLGPRIGGDLDAYSAKFNHVHVKNATIVGGLYANGAHSARVFYVTDSSVGEDLDVAGADVSEACIFSRSKIGRDACINDATIGGNFEARKTKIGRDLLARDSSVGYDFNVSHARIGRNLDASGACVKNSISAIHAEIAGAFVLSGARIEGKKILDISSAKIGVLDFGDGMKEDLYVLDLERAKIRVVKGKYPDSTRIKFNCLTDIPKDFMDYLVATKEKHEFIASLEKDQRPPR